MIEIKDLHYSYPDGTEALKGVTLTIEAGEFMLICGPNGSVHGEQSTDPVLRRLPLTYYGPGSGAGIAFSHAHELFGPAPRIGVVGLGTGTPACCSKARVVVTSYKRNSFGVDGKRGDGPPLLEAPNCA